MRAALLPLLLGREGDPCSDSERFRLCSGIAEPYDYAAPCPSD